MGITILMFYFIPATQREEKYSNSVATENVCYRLKEAWQSHKVYIHLISINKQVDIVRSIWLGHPINLLKVFKFCAQSKFFLNVVDKNRAPSVI